MSWLIDAVRPARALGFGALATLAAGGMAACGSSTAVTPTTTLVGVMADSVENGVLTMTVATGSLVTAPSSWGVKTLYAATVVDVTGTLAIQGGATVALTGTYNSGTHVIEAAGGGYTFTGTVAGN